MLRNMRLSAYFRQWQHAAKDKCVEKVCGIPNEAKLQQESSINRFCRTQHHHAQGT